MCAWPALAIRTEDCSSFVGDGLPWGHAVVGQGWGGSKWELCGGVAGFDLRGDCICVLVSSTFGLAVSLRGQCLLVQL